MSATELPLPPPPPPPPLPPSVITNEELETAFKYIIDDSILELKTFLEENEKLLSVITINATITAHEKYFNSRGLDLRGISYWRYFICKRLTVLTFASEFGSEEIVKLLLNEFKVDETVTGFADMNCFLAAVRGSKQETMRFLQVFNKELCKKRDENRCTALIIASLHASKETVKLLIDEFKDDIDDIHQVNNDGLNCFQAACIGGKHDTMRYLHSIDDSLCTLKDHAGRSALILASIYGNKETVELLINEFNADIYDTAEGISCFVGAAMYNKHETLRYLYTIDEKLIEKNEFGISALTMTSIMGSPETAKLLINEFNANIHEIGHLGHNCFAAAAEGGNHDMMKYLYSVDDTLSKAKNANGDTVLSLVCCYGPKETVQLLIDEYDADIHDLNNNGQNCFLKAATSHLDRTEVFEYLFSVDDSLWKARDKDGKSVFSLAAESSEPFEYNREYLIKLLRTKIGTFFSEWETAVITRNKASIFRMIDFPLPKSYDRDAMAIQDCCVICFTATPTHLFLPCKHVCFCRDCLTEGFNYSGGESKEWFSQLERCPYCRQRIESVYDVDTKENRSSTVSKSVRELISFYNEMKIQYNNPSKSISKK